MKIIDLTHMIKPEMPVFPGTEKPTLIKANSIEIDGFEETKLSMYSHTGTHIDAPSHMMKNEDSLDKLDVNKFIGKALIIDCKNINNHEIEIKNLITYEKKLKDVDFVLIKTGWSDYWGKDKYFERFPYLSQEAADWLINFNLKGIGVDTISIDDIKTTDFNVHYKLFENNMIIIENLTNLDKVEEDTFIFSCLPLRYENADGSPVRAIAMINI